MDIKVQRIVRLENGKGPLKAFADIIIDDLILIKGFRVVEGKHGLFVSVPQEQGKDHRWFDSVSILTSDLQKQISKVIVAAYQNEGC